MRVAAVHKYFTDWISSDHSWDVIGGVGSDRGQRTAQYEAALLTRRNGRMTPPQ